MSTNLITSLLQSWSSLALRGGSAWLSIKDDVATLLVAYSQAADARAGSLIISQLQMLFDRAGLGPLLAPILAEHTSSTLVETGSEPDPKWGTRGTPPSFDLDLPKLPSIDVGLTEPTPKWGRRDNLGVDLTEPTPKWGRRDNLPPIDIDPDAPSADAGQETPHDGAPLAGALAQLLEAESRRQINAWVEGLGADEPLQLAQTYALLFGEGGIASASRGGVELPDTLFPAGVEQVEVTILLISDDLIIHGPDQQPMLIGRRAGASAPVRFMIEPRHAGLAGLTAIFIAHNRPFQRLSLSFAVGARPAAKHSLHASGLTLENALERGEDPQRISLTIIKRENGYELLLNGGIVSRAQLRISADRLTELIELARATLGDLSQQRDGGTNVYTVPDVDVPEYVYRAALARLAQLGARLYQALFFAPLNQEDAHRMGELLRRLSVEQPLRIEVISEQFVFPWALLYDGDLSWPAAGEGPSQVDPERFWGFRHQMEYTPEFSSPTPVSIRPVIGADAGLSISYIYHRGIESGLVAAQSAWLGGLPGARVTGLANLGELYQLLNADASGSQILYFYCHAIGVARGPGQSVDSSQIMLSDGAASVSDLYTYAPPSRARLRSAPLVFLNACQSAEMNPFLYEGILPYLIAKGARGVVGTEADIPAQFAAEFAQAVLQRFIVDGQTLGESLHTARRWYLEQRHNVLGLLYVMHCNAELRV